MESPPASDPAGWSDLPSECLEQIILHAGGRAAASCAGVCRSWRRDVESDALWRKLAAMDLGLSGSNKRRWKEAYRRRHASRKMWDACTPRRTDIWAGHTGWISGVSSAGGTALTSSFDRTLRVWDRETGQWSHVLKGHSGQVTCCALGDGGITAASGSRDRTVRMWAVQREECTDTFSTPENSGPVGGVAFAGGLVVAAYNDGRARAWDPRSGKIARTLAGHDGPVFGVAADGLTVATCGADRSVHVWDLGSGDCKASLSGHDDGVLGVDILGDVVASGGLEGEVRVWSAVTWRCCHVLRGHEDWVRSVALRRDRVASSSRDGTVRTWSVDRGELLGTLPCGGADVRAVCMDDEYVLAGAVDGSVRAWAFGAEEMP